MADEQLFSAEVDGPAAPAGRKSGWQTCLTGCLVVFVILVVIAVLIGFWISRNWRDWVATGVTEVVRHGISGSQLPAQEQQEIMVQVDRITNALRERKISVEQVQVLVQTIVQSPLMSLMIASTLEQQYFAKSGLSEQEKTEGRQTLQRFIRGAIDEKINEASIDGVMAHVADRDAQGKWELRQALSDEELRAFLVAAKTQADAAEIPDQPVDIDPSGEIKKIVDAALGGPA